MSKFDVSLNSLIFFRNSFKIGHRKLRAFVTHGGLLSMFESVYHGVPLVTMPVFCDHDVNAAKAVADGYALRLDLETLSSDKLSKLS